MKQIPLSWIINSYPWPARMESITRSVPIVTRITSIQTEGSPHVIHRLAPDLTYKKV